MSFCVTIKFCIQKLELDELVNLHYYLPQLDNKGYDFLFSLRENMSGLCDFWFSSLSEPL